MCGRYTQTQKQAVIKKMFGIEKVIAEISQIFNVCPGQDVATIAGHKERRLGLMRWGLPAACTGGRPVINARAETLRDKPMFNKLLAKRRCLFVADGFYEWRAVDGRKKPVYIRMKDRTPFLFAGLWHFDNAYNGDKRPCGTIITTTANKLISPVHHRMPVILPPDSIDAWLDTKYSNIDSLLKPYPDEAMVWHPVSDAVNSPRNDGPELIKPLAG